MGSIMQAITSTLRYCQILQSQSTIWVVLRKGAPMCDIELVALDLHIWVARLVHFTTYTV